MAVCVVCRVRVREYLFGLITFNGSMYAFM